MRQFDYPCPDCRSTSNLHADGCNYSNRDREEFERAYFDILTQLTISPKPKIADEELVHNGNGDGLMNNCRGAWTAVYEDCLIRLKHEYIIVEEENVFRIMGKEERKDAVSEPQHEPMKTLYEKGSVPGAHDNAVFAMVAFYEMVGLSWTETRENVLEWLDETGTWKRGGFAEKSPEELVEKKRHVYDQGYGWREKAEAAKRVIDQKVGSD